MKKALHYVDFRKGDLNQKVICHSRLSYELQSIPPLLKHIFVTFLPSRKKQINSLLLYLLETLINSTAKRTSSLGNNKKSQGLWSGE